MTIPEILARQARERGEQIAIIEGSGRGERTITFAELAGRAGAFAKELTRRGVGKGDPVLVFIPMSIDLYAVMLGIFQAGAVAMFLDPSAGLRHIDRCCELMPPAAFTGGLKARLFGLLSAGIRRTRIHLGPPTSCSDEIAASISPDDPALITFTSGSTGEPKAAVRTHAFLLAQYAALRRAIRLEPGETDLATLPIFVLANLAAGATSLLPDVDMRHPGAVNPEPVVRQVERHRPTRTGGSPAFYERLDGHPKANELFAGFRKIYTGGAPVFPGFLQRLQQLAPAADVVAVFGSTEAEPIAEIAWREFSTEDIQRMRAGGGLLTGKPVPEICVRVIEPHAGRSIAPLSSAEFENMRRAVGAPGEIVVSGPHVLHGYLHGRGDEETKFRVDGAVWHRTGDAGYFDEQGRLWLLGRISAVISVGNRVIYPFAVECIARESAFVHRAAVIARGEEIALVIERKQIDGGDEEALFAAVSPHGVTRILPVPKIPMDRRHNAKVDYPALRKLIGRYE